MTKLTQIDSYLKDDGPAAIVLKQPMMPVEGEDGVFFPSTYASGDGFAGGYNIDTDASGRSVALIDSVGSLPRFGLAICSFPRSKERGLIEARNCLLGVRQLLDDFPCSNEHGLIDPSKN